MLSLKVKKNKSMLHQECNMEIIAILSALHHVNYTCVVLKLRYNQITSYYMVH